MYARAFTGSCNFFVFEKKSCNYVLIIDMKKCEIAYCN